MLSPRLSRALAARGAIACLLGLAALGPGVACAADPPPARAGATPVAPTPGSPDSALSIEVARTGLEGSAASRARKSIGVTYENRRYREPAIALGHVARVARESDQPPDSIWGIERRLGLPSAAMPFRVGQAPDRVIYPGESSFPPPPAGRRWGSTERSLDLVLTPLITYELGRIYEPVLLRVEIAPELRINPWPGARARASVIIPLHNDFTPDELSPDIGRVRPGVSTLEQYAWLPGSLLASASGGIFADNRYGFSAGLARPMADGLLWLDTQADLTGFIAFPDSGLTYSTPERWTGFAGFTIRPRSLPAALRIRFERYLYGDQGIEAQLQRSLGDVELALYLQRIEGENIGGVRLTLPLPPMNRGVGGPVRMGLSERFTIDYRDKVLLEGTPISGAASREDFMRKLDTSSLRANQGRYLEAAGTPAERATHPFEPVSLVGMTGFINTPWCGVEPNGDIDIGANTIPKEAAYDHRNEFRNDVYYATVGFLPHAEVGFRWTVIPGLRAFQDVAPDSKLTDSDRMLSGRLELLKPRPGRPGLAVGIEDAVGTRRFHSEYAVAGMEPETWPLRTRLSLGYAFKALTANRYTLEGAFGAVQVRPWRAVDVALEHDSEKVNAQLGYELGFGFRARVALLSLRYTAVGLGWSHTL